MKAASPEDFPCAVLDVSPLLFPEVKAEGYLVGWLSRTPSDGGSIPPAQPSYWLDTPSSYLTRKGLRCDFHTSVKGMWLPHLPRLGRVMALWVAMPAVFSARYSIPFCTQSPRIFPVTFTVNLKRSHNHFPCAKVV